MSELSVVNRLRPTRIALLTSPTDASAVRKFMRICTTLWGGVYNPIIPVFKTAPAAWRPRHPELELVSGTGIARGYADFYEPDIYVEAKKGLLETAGLGSLRGNSILHDRIIGLDDVLVQHENHTYAEPSVGLSVMDVLRHAFATEQKFQLREPRTAVVMTPSASSPFVEAMFGGYPTDEACKYIAQEFEEVFRPEHLEATPETWLKIIGTRAMTPLGVTRSGLRTNRSWQHDLMVFVFDPSKAIDLIDLWNLRLEPRPILPVPLPWFADLADAVHERLLAEHRPLEGNPSGVMHQGMVEFGRSISEDRAKAAMALLKSLPNGAAPAKLWRTPIWEPKPDSRIHRDERLEVTAKERRTTVEIKEEGKRLAASVEALAPDFAEQFGANHMRWVNALRVNHYGQADVATVIPFNTRDLTWPRAQFAAEPVQICSEGWIFGQQYNDTTETIELHRREDIVIGALKQSGVTAALSEPGHIAKQVMAHLGGMRNVPIIADASTLTMLNEMAGGLRRRERDGATSEEVFDRRSRSYNDWRTLIAKRNAARDLGHKASLEKFTGHNIIRLGIHTRCPHCQNWNWHSLTAADYSLTCERCLKAYPFPQADLAATNNNWYYRTIGPFSVHDYARGGYGALLALNVLHRLGGSFDSITFSTALTLKFDGKDYEADYAAFFARDRHERHGRPRLVLGEAKSFGAGELIKADDLAKLKAIGDKLPGSVIVISVMRDHFTAAEKKLLTAFVKWARKPNELGRPSHLVVLLTGHELFADFSIERTWKKLGGAHAKYATYDHAHILGGLADATQAIYLGVPTFRTERRAALEKKFAKIDAKKLKGGTKGGTKAEIKKSKKP